MYYFRADNNWLLRILLLPFDSCYSLYGYCLAVTVLLYSYAGVHLYILWCCKNVSSCQELLIHWINDFFYYIGLQFLLINKLNHYNLYKHLSSKPANRSTIVEFLESASTWFLSKTCLVLMLNKLSKLHLCFQANLIFKYFRVMIIDQ